MESYHGEYKIHVSDSYITEDDISAIVEALRHKCLSEGKYVKLFENEFARYVDTKHAIAVSSGTTALHVTLTALGVGRGDEVIVPSFSFIATANCVLYQGAKPIFADIDPLTLNIDPKPILARVGEKTKAIVVVHYAGHSVEMREIVEIVEDTVAAMINALETEGIEGEIINVGTERTIKMREILKIIMRYTCAEKKNIVLDEKRLRPKDVDTLITDNKRASKLLG